MDKEPLIEPRHFVLLDVLKAGNRGKSEGSNPFVQILNPSDMNSFTDNRTAAKFHPENRLTKKGKKKISLHDFAQP